MSIGLLTLAVGGRNAWSRARTSGPSSTTWSPAASQASTARIPGPPAFVTMPTRVPCGSGWASRHAAMSNISSIVSARMTPDCRNSASTATSLAASAAVWLPAARDPACDRPALSATIGLSRPMRRASRPKRRGFPNDSRYSRITRVRGSDSQYSSRSLLETSALFPTLTNDESPIWRSAARRRMAMPSAPLCDDNAIVPAGGQSGENDAFIRTAGSVLRSPIQFGPIIRIPYPRTRSANASCRASPSPPISENPAVMTTIDFTDAAAQSSTAERTQSGGTTITARSVPVGRSRAECTATRPSTSAAIG